MGIGDVLKKALWFFLAASIVVAIFRGIPPNPNAWLGWAQEQTQDIQEWAGGIGDTINGWVDEQEPLDSIIPDEGDSSQKPKAASGKKAKP